MLDLSAFGKNDIRGIYGENINEEIFYYTGRGFVKYLFMVASKRVKRFVFLIFSSTGAQMVSL